METNENQGVFDHLDKIQSESVQYVQTSLKYYKLLGFKVAMQSASAFVSLVLILLFSSMILLFGSLALAYYFGELVNDTALGFLVVAGIYAFLFLLFLIFRKQLIEPLVLKAGVKIFSNQHN